MKKYLTFFLLLILFLLKGVFSQPYGNEWIDYSQKYYKIKVAEDGIYRISFSALASSGIDVSKFDPRQFQIFHKGIEQYIYVHGENDGVFNASDYIEFYGMRNRGTLDSFLYVNPHNLPNPDYSLINDTSVYFLTWNSSITNRRLQIENDKDFSGYIPKIMFGLILA